MDPEERRRTEIEVRIEEAEWAVARLAGGRDARARYLHRELVQLSNECHEAAAAWSRLAERLDHLLQALELPPQAADSPPEDEGSPPQVGGNRPER
ncbi:MAG: hypothetical protein Kow00129_02400 [Thermoleophilia bacterium]